MPLKSKPKRQRADATLAPSPTVDEPKLRKRRVDRRTTKPTFEPERTAGCSSEEASPSSSSVAPIIILPTYHSAVGGYAFLRGTKTGESQSSSTSAQLKLIFSTRQHVGSVRCVAGSKKMMATCGADERIFLHTLNDPKAGPSKQDQGIRSLSTLGSNCPASQVNCAAFPDSRFLLCGCEDGTLAVYRTRDWECPMVLTVHDAAIQGLDIHRPSGASLAVTTSKDRTLAFVDLVKGRVVTRHKFSVLEGAPEQVVFGVGGGTSLLLATQTAYAVYVFSAAAGQLRLRCDVMEPRQPPFQVQCLCFLSPTVILFGDESGRFWIVDVRSAAVEPKEEKAEGTQAKLIVVKPSVAQVRRDSDAPAQQAHSRRVRAVQGVKYDDTTAQCTLMASCDAEGEIVVWDVQWREGAPVLAEAAKKATNGRSMGLAVL